MIINRSYSHKEEDLSHFCDKNLIFYLLFVIFIDKPIIMYTQTVTLEDNERAASINQDTGEVKVKGSKHKPLPIGVEVFLPSEPFKKIYSSTWIFLETVLTDKELIVVHRLAQKAQYETNALIPLNDDMPNSLISEELGISINRVTKTLKKLYDLGVYAKFEIVTIDRPYTKYWILNPYLSFSGKLIKSDIALLFKDTIVARQYRPI